MKNTVSIACIMAAVFGVAAPAAAFEPDRPVEFVVTAGPGGGTDIFARTIQAIIGKYELMKAPVVVTNKGSAGGAEGFVYTATNKGDAYKLTFGTNNAYLLPVRAKVPYKIEDLTPVAALASDEFILWVNGKASYNTAADFAAKAKEGGLKIGYTAPDGTVGPKAFVAGADIAELLDTWLWRWAAFLIVFGVMVLVTIGLALLGYLKVRRIRGPQQTIESVKETKEALTPGHDRAPELPRPAATDPSGW
mgnify:CR=1 FL=1